VRRLVLDLLGALAPGVLSPVLVQNAMLLRHVRQRESGILLHAIDQPWN